ncbi:hypothetical protein MGAST_15135 [Mycobacterium gastri 'Wayne']|nr:hypothetical protein MGAST_15135 [Mycobacterium gastri 'Wayne']
MAFGPEAPVAVHDFDRRAPYLRARFVDHSTRSAPVTGLLFMV